MGHQETITFSLPSNIIKEIDKIAEKENITREQILSEALTQCRNKAVYAILAKKT